MGWIPPKLADAAGGIQSFWIPDPPRFGSTTLGYRAAMQPTILIVDDEPQLLRLLVRVLEREGYPVLAAGEGRLACEFIDRDADGIAALVLDCGVAPSGAAPVLEHAIARRSDIGVVLVSGDQLAPGLADWIDSHGGLFLRKPFRPAALVDAVRTALDVGRSSPR